MSAQVRRCPICGQEPPAPGSIEPRYWGCEQCSDQPALQRFVDLFPSVKDALAFQSAAIAAALLARDVPDYVGGSTVDERRKTWEWLSERKRAADAARGGK